MHPVTRMTDQSLLTHITLKYGCINHGDQKVFFHSEISINVLVSSFRFSWIPTCEGTVFRCQNLTSVDDRFWRLKKGPIYRCDVCIMTVLNRYTAKHDYSRLNLFTTIHDGNFRRHSSMNVTIKWHKFSSNILHLCIFRHLKLEIALAIPASNDENRTPTPVYLDPGMHPGLEVKGLNGGYWERNGCFQMFGIELNKYEYFSPTWSCGSRWVKFLFL